MRAKRSYKFEKKKNSTEYDNLLFDTVFGVYSDDLFFFRSHYIIEIWDKFARADVGYTYAVLMCFLSVTRRVRADFITRFIHITIIIIIIQIEPAYEVFKTGELHLQINIIVPVFRATL